MLTRLYIENIAVIEKTEIVFDIGLNVLTGETGAGKSIIIDSINAILGKKVSKDILREGSKNAFVSATFSEISEEVKAFIEENGFSLDENDELIVQRELSESGKTVARINGRPTTVSVLKIIGEKLVNIHGQHDNMGLLSQQTHLDFIDEFGFLKQDLQKYFEFYEELLGLRKQLAQFKIDESEKARKIDLLEYQIQELESANLKNGELELLEEQRTYLLNKEKITSSIEYVKGLLSGNDERDGIVSLFQLASNEMVKLEELYPNVKDLSAKFKELSYELSECEREFFDLSPDFENESGELNEIEERLSLISSLSRKYGETISDMLMFLENAKTELQRIEMSDEETSKLQEKFLAVKAQTQALAESLSDKRRKVAKEFISKVGEELVFLDMPKVNIEVSQTKRDLNKFGCDDLEILISTNPGQHPKPISKIASGGELSRLMLAIKNVLSHNNDVGTLIFDEIDTGISGSAAQKVGMKLKSLSDSRQVFCVTHLAQIAVLADQHFLITKNINENETFTEVKKLSFEYRKKEVARIIGGSTITDITLKNAEEMLKICK